MNDYKVSGDCNHGQYFWCSDLVVVEKITQDVIAEIVADLIKTGELKSALSQLADEDDE